MNDLTCWLADQAGYYGMMPHNGDDENCTCRNCWEIEVAERARKIVKTEIARYLLFRADKNISPENLNVENLVRWLRNEQKIGGKFTVDQVISVFTKLNIVEPDAVLNLLCDLGLVVIVDSGYPLSLIEVK